jgi:hypothetical protein
MRSIDRNNRLVYIHPAKCAGKSIEHALFNFPKGSKSNHMRAWQYKKLLTKPHFYFSFVRNPWSRYISSLFDRAIRHTALNYSIEEITIVGVKKCLEQDLSAIKDRPQPWSKTDWDLCPYSGGGMASYKEFFCDLDGNLLLDFVGRVETLDQDWKLVGETISEKVGKEHSIDSSKIFSFWPQKLPKINSAKYDKRKHYSHYYDAESKEMLRDLYSWDISFFQYEFEDKSS